jgi:multiple sugar transport system substrate-binding protein
MHHQNFGIRRHAAYLLMFFAAIGGCNQEQPNSPELGASSSRPPLRILVIDDEPLANAVKLAWDSRVGGDTKVTNVTSTELLEFERNRLNADVILYPSWLLGELAERDLIQPLDSDAAADAVLSQQGLFDLIRLHEVVWGSDVYAVPLGSPQFTLLYRKDIFGKLQLEPPTTWDEYQALAKQLSDRKAIGELASSDEEPWFGTVEPLAASWAGPMLLARAAAYARHRNQYSTLFDFNSMKPLIASPPFERALKEQTAVADNTLTATPASARAIFLNGQAAMAITWPSRAADASVDQSTDRTDWIGVAELPGSSEVYNFRTKAWESRAEGEDSHVSLIAADGRIGSVTKSSRYKKQALGMLFMISGDELGTTIGSSSSHTTMFRESQFGQVNAWVDQALDGDAARQYGAVVRSSQSRSAWLDAIRIPLRDKYIAALDTAVNSVIAGDATPAEALQSAAEQWDQITDLIGRESQQKAYMRSLGLQP